MALILGAVIIYQAFLILEHSILFYPSHQHIWNPTESNIEYEDVWFYNQQVKLHGWILAGKNRKSPIILYCHGNTGNISHRKYIIHLFQSLDFPLFIFDYQGYGLSKGCASLENLCSDGKAAFDYLLSIGYSPDDIIVWGESLGGMTAIEIASHTKCYRVLLMSTFFDLNSLVLESNSMLGKAAVALFKLQGITSNQAKIRSITSPVFVIHSKEDEIIPYSHGLAIYNNINHTWKQMASIEGAHGNPIIKQETIEEIMKFCWQEQEITPQCLEILDYVAREDNKHG